MSKSLASWRSCSWRDGLPKVRWAQEIGARPSAQRGRMVNRTFGKPSRQLHERHDASDFDAQTQDKLHPEV